MLLYVAFMKQRFCEKLTNHSLKDGSYHLPAVQRVHYEVGERYYQKWESKWEMGKWEIPKKEGRKACR